MVKFTVSDDNGKKRKSQNNRYLSSQKNQYFSTEQDTQGEKPTPGQTGRQKDRYFPNDGEAQSEKPASRQPAVDESSSFGPHAAGVLDGETEAYLNRLRDTFEDMVASGENEPSNGFSDPNDVDGDNPSPLTLMARNSLTELSAQMLQEVSRHNVACRLVEKLLPYAGAASCIEILDTLLKSGPRQFASLAVHPCASHLLQRCLFGAQDSDDYPSELTTTLTSWTKDMMCEVMVSSSGSHVFRAILSLLARIPNENERSNSRLLDNVAPSARFFDNCPKTPNDMAKKAVIAVALKLLELTPDLTGNTDEDGNMAYDQRVVDDLHRLASRPTSCAALQSLLTAVAVCDMGVTGKLANAILPKRNEELLELMESRVASRLIERIILIFNPDELEFPPSIQSIMQDNDTFMKLIEHPSANFCVQQYILRLTNRGSVARVARLLEDPIENQLLSYGSGATPRDGVVLALLRVAEAHADQSTQTTISRAIARGVAAIDKDGPNLVGHLLLRGKAMWTEWHRRVEQLDLMRTSQSKYRSSAADGDNFIEHGQFNQNSFKRLSLPGNLPRMSTIGALLARALMRLREKPGQMARASMAALSPKTLLAFCADSTASRVVDQWILSDPDMKRNEKVCTKVISALLGDPQKLDSTKPEFIATVQAVCRNPSAGAVLTQSTLRANSLMRRKVMDGLSAAYDSLVKDDFGSIVLRKCRVRKYMSRNEDWEKKETEHETRKRVFADILGDDDVEADAEAGADDDSGENYNDRANINNSKAKDITDSEKLDAKRQKKNKSKKRKSGSIAADHGIHDTAMEDGEQSKKKKHKKATNIGSDSERVAIDGDSDEKIAKDKSRSRKLKKNGEDADRIAKKSKKKSKKSKRDDILS